VDRVRAIPECSDPVPLPVVLEKSGYKSVRDLRRQDPALHWKLVAQHRKTGRIAWKERMRNARAATLAMIEGALIASLNLDCPELLTDTPLRLSFETSTPLAFHFPKLCAAMIAKRAEWKRRRWAEKEAIVHQSARLEVPPTVEAFAISLCYQSRTLIRKRFASAVSVLAARFSERANKRRQIVLRALKNALNKDLPIERFAKRAGWSRSVLSKDYFQRQAAPSGCITIGRDKPESPLSQRLRALPAVSVLKRNQVVLTLAQLFSLPGLVSLSTGAQASKPVPAEDPRCRIERKAKLPP
jgi:hypothetical protein